MSDDAAAGRARSVSSFILMGGIAVGLSALWFYMSILSRAREREVAYRVSTTLALRKSLTDLSQDDMEFLLYSAGWTSSEIGGYEAFVAKPGLLRLWPQESVLSMVFHGLSGSEHAPSSIPDDLSRLMEADGGAVVDPMDRFDLKRNGSLELFRAARHVRVRDWSTGKMHLVRCIEAHREAIEGRDSAGIRTPGTGGTVSTGK